jgi:hypothetical protein
MIVQNVQRWYRAGNCAGAGADGAEEVHRYRGAEVVQRYRGTEVQLFCRWCRGEEVLWCRYSCAVILGFALMVQRCRENVAEVMQRLSTAVADIL